MTFRQLALSNVRGNALKYAAFFLSSVASVAIFFVYSLFVMHPDVTSGAIYGGQSAVTVLVVCQVLVALFALVFVLYSNGAFMRARHREFGLMSLMGVTPRQLRRMLWLENSLLSVVAVVGGLALGLLLSRLFLLAIGRILDLEQPLRFVLAPEAAVLTFVAFLAVFQVASIMSAAGASRQRVGKLLVSAREPERPQKASVWLALLGFVLVAVGYKLALGAYAEQVIAVFIPVVALVVTGTYLLFGNGFGMVLGVLKRSDRLYLSGTGTLIISQLLSRARSNARLLATIASLSAVVLSAAGSFYIVTRVLNDSVHEQYPQELAFVERARPVANAMTHARVDDLLAENGVGTDLRLGVPLVTVSDEDGSRFPARILIGREAYSALTAVSAAGTTMDRWSPEPGASLGGMPEDLRAAVEAVPEPRVSLPQALWATEWYVLDDAQFDTLLGDPSGGSAVLGVPEGAEAVTLWLYDWTSTNPRGPLGRALSSSGDPDRPEGMPDVDSASRFAALGDLLQLFGLSLFAGVFVSLLFFVGAGSLIYFKLFTELEDDRRLHARLRRIGVTPRESARVVTWRIGITFLLPFAVGALHAAVALGTFQRMLLVDVASYTAIVLVLFAVVQAGFFLLTRTTYLRALQAGA